MEKLSSRGHILVMSPKCHPELAGVGIENSWGKSALYFRKHNDYMAQNLMSNVLDSKQPDTSKGEKVCKAHT